MRLIVVVGARPNFIKVGPLVPALRAAGHQTDIVHTGQHYDELMSDVFFTDLNIPEPAWFLDVGSGTHAVQTGVAMMRLEELLIEQRPDALIVVGDVNSTLAGALAAAKIGIPCVHLEAGLRSWDMSMPEEVNRLVTDQLSSMHLTPVAEADENLVAENIDRDRIHLVGNIMAESVLRHAREIEGRQTCAAHGHTPGEYLLSTIHRPENTDRPENMAAILSAFASAPLPVLMPVHPRTRPLLAEFGVDESHSRITLIDPVGYLDMLALQRDAAAIVTDSGGIQEEACMLGVPCVTIRRNTERAITVEVGANRLVRAEQESILAGIDEALAGPRDWERPDRWDDQVARRVTEALAGGIKPLSGVE